MGQIAPHTDGTDHPDDRLPSYEDVIDPPHQNQVPAPSSLAVPGARSYHSVSSGKRQSGSVTLSPLLSRTPDELHRLITQQARVPPQPCIRVQGTHTETRRDGRETKKNVVTDFDFQLDLTRHLLPCENPGVWRELKIVRDNDGLKEYRGGRWPSRNTRDTKPKGRTDLEQGNEALLDPANESDEGSPSLMGWCERFCADPAPVKSFTFKRHLFGLNTDPMRSVFTSYLRSANYRGKVQAWYSLANGSITVYSPHWINHLRNNPFFFWACIILQLWIVTWPVIWFLERRYEVVRSAWWSSREVCDPTSPSGIRKVYARGQDEAALAEFWGPAVVQTAYEQWVDGSILTDQDAMRLRRLGQRRMEQMPRQDSSLERNLQVADSMVGRMLGFAGRGDGQRLTISSGGWNFSTGWGSDR